MSTFRGWRSVGRAMRWARRQDGVGVERTRIEGLSQILFTWAAGDQSVYVDFVPGGDPADVTFHAGGTEINRARLEDAATALRVLAALDLIPAELVEIREERYRMCVKCDRLARLWDDGPGFEPRWVHVTPIAITGPSAHRAEVAE